MNQSEFETIDEAYNEVVRLRAALQRIANCEDAPDIDATGIRQTGLHCGVEDRSCRDRYEGADYGHTVGAEKALEWAKNEADFALANVAGEPQPHVSRHRPRHGDAVGFPSGEQ